MSAREVAFLGDGWAINSQVTTNVTKAITTEVRSRTVNTVESKDEKATESRTVESTERQKTGGQYQSQILPPINPDNSSVWPSKRGVIPVQFKVAKAGELVEERSVSTPQTQEVTATYERTVSRVDTATDATVTTTTTKTPRFESVCGPEDTAWSVLVFDGVPDGTTVEDITKLQAKFNWLEGASAGGSHRWQIGTDLGNIHVYYGDSHDWTGTSGSDINLMDATDDRFDDSNIGGTFYNTKQQILDKHAGLKVNNLALAVDSCWASGDQRLSLDHVTVGIEGADFTKNDPLAPKTSTDVQTSSGEWVLGTPVPGDWERKAPRTDRGSTGPGRLR